MINIVRPCPSSPFAAEQRKADRPCSTRSFPPALQIFSWFGIVRLALLSLISFIA